MSEPYDVKAEQLVLAAALQCQRRRARAIAALKPVMFRGEHNKAAYDAVTTLTADGAKVDVGSVAARAEGDFGGLKRLRQLAKTEIPEDIDPLLDRLRKDAAARTVVARLKELEEDAEGGADFSEVLADAREAVKILEAAPLRAAPDPGIATDALLRAFDDRCEGGAFRTMGYESLDSVLTYGLAPGVTTVVAGRPTTGKTIMLTDMVRRVRRANKRVKRLVLPFERGREYFLTLLAVSVTRVDLRIAVSEPGSLPEKDRTRFRKALERLSSDPHLHVLDDPPVRAERDQNVAAVERIRELVEVGGYEQVFIDLLGRRLKDKRWSAVSVALEAHAEWVSRGSCHVIATHQLSRQQDREQRQSRRSRPTVDMLKESGAWEETSDQIVLLHRQAVHGQRTSTRDTLEAEVAKQKVGPIGDVMLARFKPEMCRLGKDRLRTAEDARGGVRFTDGGDR